MLTKTSIFDGKYFRYIMKKLLPYSMVMALVLILSSFLVYGFGSSTYISGAMSYYPPWMIGITANVGMYIIPIALSVGIFGFLHKKNSTDFIFGTPVKRSAMFLTSIIAAFIIMAVTLLLNSLFIALMVEGLWGGGYMYVAPQSYILMYFYNLAGYMLVFVTASLAATLTGTALSQILITFVIMLLPAFLLCYLQLPFVIQYSGGFDQITYSMPIDAVVLLPDIASAPLTMIFMEAAGNEIANFYGVFEYFANIRAICFTILLAIIYGAVGVYLFKRYKAESSGRAFINKGVNIFAFSGVFAPIMLFIFFVFAEGIGYVDMLEEALFYVFIVLIWVAFVIASLIFNKGFSGFGRQMRMFFTLLVVTCIVSGIMYVIGDNSEKTFSFKEQELKSITVYMEPINTSPIDNQNVKGTYKKVTITDPEILRLLSRGEREDTFFFDVVTESGKKMTLRGGLSDQFINGLYDYIDENENVKKSLFSYSGAKKIISSSLTFKSTIQGAYVSTPLHDMKEVTRIVAAKELEYLEKPIRELYINNNNNKYYYGGIYIEERVDYAPLEESSLSLTVSALRYDNGQYFISSYNIDYDSEFFTNFAEDVHDDMTDLIKDIEKYGENFSATIAGAFELDEKQYVNLAGMIESMPHIMREEFLEAVKNATRSEIIPENTVGVYLTTHYDQNIVFMNIDRDIKPLIDIYFDKVTAMLQTDTSYYMAVGALIDGTQSIHSGYFSRNTFAVSSKELAQLLTENREEIVKLITEAVTDETVRNEYYFVHLSNDPYYTYEDEDKINTPITSEMLQIICPRFDYFETKASLFDPSYIDHIIYENEDKKITDRDDIEYLTSLLKHHYFADEVREMRNTEEDYYYDYKYERSYAYYDLKFITVNGGIEFAQIPETDRVYEILYGKG